LKKNSNEKQRIHMSLFSAFANFRVNRTTLRHFVLSGLAFMALLLTITACTPPPSAKAAGVTPTPLPTFTLTINNPGNLISSTLTSTLRSEFNSVYPTLYQRFGNANTATSVTLTIYTSTDGTIAGTDAANATVLVNAVWQNAHTNDLGWFTYELTHVVQNYSGSNLPGWFTEGMSGYARYYYAPAGETPFTQIPGSPSSSDSYTGGAGTVARYLIWLQERKSSTIVDQLNHALQTAPNTFATVFQQIAGGTLDNVWAQYVADPTLKQDADCPGNIHTAYWVAQSAGTFVAHLTVQNRGTVATTSWTFSFTFPNTQKYVSGTGTGGIFSQSGETLTVKNSSSNGALAPGAATYPRFTATWSGIDDNPIDSSFKVNGQTCTGVRYS
jgi:hypothetical protein